MSLYNSSMCSDEAPSWDSLSEKLILLNVIDYSITTTRLKYEQFEKIFHSLFVLIDPSECRKKFRSIYPAQDHQDRTRFMETAVNFINDKHLSPNKISLSQLRALGGEPFRRVLSFLIEEINKRRKYFENIMPQVTLAPLFEERTANMQVYIEDFEKILSEFPDKRGHNDMDDKEVIDITKQAFGKN